eukprot:GHUV01024191.1.p1 GENE.GHUV01024191.1~~GHUV01024191.1.p1  ORF type:complete len:663 (+),score=225.98 GHUV01024191.1:233-2221(+)
MSGRAAPWRSKPSQEFQQLQAQLSTPNSSLYMLQRLGPASFIIGQSSLDEEHADAKYKVTLGNVPSCSCSLLGAMDNREPCIHLLFVLIRIFRMPSNNALLWQSALTDRELQQILDGSLSRYATSSNTSSRSSQQQAGSSASSSAASTSSAVQRRTFEEDEPCPICYELLTAVSKEWLVWCHNGCGRSIHGKCMRVWNDHQTKTLHQDITCPLCRCPWGVFDWRPPPTPAASSSHKASFGKPHHRGVKCVACQQSPIEGARYRCLSCAHYNLCSDCFSSGQHLQHSFACQQTPTSLEQIAERPGLAGMVGMFHVGGLLPSSSSEGAGSSITAGSGSGAVTSMGNSGLAGNNSARSSSSRRSHCNVTAPLTAALQLQPASTRGSSSTACDGSGKTPGRANAFGAGIRRGCRQQHQQQHQHQQQQQLPSRQSGQLQLQELVVGAARAAVSPPHQEPPQQQQQHGSPAQLRRHSPMPTQRRPSPASAAGAAAIARELQALAVTGWGGAPDTIGPSENHVGFLQTKETSSNKQHQQQSKVPSRRASSSSTPDALGRKQPLSFELIGAGPATDTHISSEGTSASSGPGLGGPAVEAGSISASNIGSIGTRTTRRSTAEAVAATGPAGKRMGMKRVSKGSSSSSSGVAMPGGDGLRLQQGNKAPSGGH